MLVLVEAKWSNKNMDLAENPLQHRLLQAKHGFGPKSSCNTAVAIDVVFNPWVIDVAEHDNIFKSYVADLALNWVVKDNGATFLLRPGWKFIPNFCMLARHSFLRWWLANEWPQM